MSGHFENIINKDVLKLELPASFHKKTRTNLVEAMKKHGNIKEKSIALFKGDTSKPIQD